jgi:hypothetical protein
MLNSAQIVKKVEFALTTDSLIRILGISVLLTKSINFTEKLRVGCCKRNIIIVWKIVIER